MENAAPKSPVVNYAAPAAKPNGALVWTGRVISAIPVLFMVVMSSAMLIFNPAGMNKGMADHGYPSETWLPIILVEIACAIIYAIPQTAFLGAILLTGYLGGAVATHVRSAEFGQAIFPFIFGMIVWLGLYLREPRLRALVPLWR